MDKLLFLAANPLETERVRLDEECRDIEEGLAAIRNRPIAFKSKWSVRVQDLQRALLEENPSLVHFSAHGDEYGRMLLENPIGGSEPVEFAALTEFFRVFRSSVRCVILSYCDSDDQARELSTVVDCVIGMKGTVSVGAALAFSTSFYQALAFGKDIATAFELGRVQIQLQSLDEEGIPKLYFREGIETRPIDGREEDSGTDTVSAGAREQIEHLAAALGLGEIDLRVTPVELSPPPIVEKCSLRTTMLDEIEGRLVEKPWYAVHGGVGTGKTHLATLLARRRERPAWLRLRGLDAAQSAGTLDRALSSVKERKSRQPRLDWYRDCCTALGPTSILVLDDLPRTSGRDEFDDALIFLARSLRASGAKLLTLSHYPLSPAVVAAAQGEIFEEAIPPFNDADIIELLAAHGAPAPFLTSGWARTVSAACRQHPVLLAAAARFLESKSWRTDSKTFMDVMTGKYAINLDAPTQADLLHTVQEKPTRDLLYRLRCVGDSFTLADARELASVPETIDHSSERLRSLLGLWVQQDGADRFVVSPLISRLQDANLAKSTEQKVHELLGRRLIGTKPITALAACRAISHFVMAGLYAQAGALLLSALNSFSKAKKPKDDALLSKLWTHTRLPQEMPRSIRIGIRSMQISINEGAQRDASFLIDDLEQLINSDSEKGESANFDVAVGGFAGMAFWAKKPVVAIRAIIKSLTALRRIDGKAFGVRSQTLRKNYLELLWSAASQISREGDLPEALDLLSKLSATEVAAWMNSRNADMGAEVLCNGFWLREHAKTEPERDWQRSLGALSAIREWANKRNARVLFAWAQCGTIIVLAEYLKRFDDAVQVGSDSLQVCEGSPKATFWLREALGRQYYYVGRWQNALDTLLPAVEGSAEVLPYKRAYVTALAGVNAAHIATTKSLDLFSRAAELASVQKDDASWLLAAVVETELAFELWNSGSRIPAFHCLSRAADRLLDPRRPNDDWKIVITLFGNFAGYFTHLARAEGKYVWTSALPAPGRMLDKNDAVLDLFDPEKLNVIPAQLTLLAEGLGLHQEALRWAQRANLAGFHAGMHKAIAPYRVAAHLLGGRWTEALEECWALCPQRTQEPVDGQMPEKLASYLAKTTATLICFALGAARIEEGKEEAERIVTVLESNLKRLEPSADDLFWQEFAAVARQIAVGSENWKLLYEAGIGWETKDDHGLGLICRIAALMHAEPSEAFHLTTHSFARPLIAWITDTLYATIVLPFLVAYWRWSCQSLAFHYSAPIRTAKALDSAFAPGDYLGFVRGLSVVAHSLNINLYQNEVELLRMVR